MKHLTLSNKAKASLRSSRNLKAVRLKVEVIDNTRPAIKGRTPDERRILAGAMTQEREALEQAILNGSPFTPKGALIGGGRPGTRRNALKGEGIVTRHFCGNNNATVKQRKAYMDKQGRLWESKAAFDKWRKEL